MINTIFMTWCSLFKTTVIWHTCIIIYVTTYLILVFFEWSFALYMLLGMEEAVSVKINCVPTLESVRQVAINQVKGKPGLWVDIHFNICLVNCNQVDKVKNAFCSVHRVCGFQVKRGLCTLSPHATVSTVSGLLQHKVRLQERMWNRKQWRLRNLLKHSFSS